MDNCKISRSQEKVLIEIIKYRNQHGFPPTVRELCSLTGLSSTSSVARHLNNLKSQGYITWISAMPRTLVVLKEVG